MFVRRIMGIETEYGLTYTHTGQHRNVNTDELARVMFRPVLEQWQSSNIFTINGSRLYLDVGSHPEIATAECDSLSQLLAYEQAGDRIVETLARQAEETLKADGLPGTVYVLKNNLDSVGNSYGCHENYLVGREVVLKTLGKALLPFLITRQLICGAGSVKDGSFQLSQRADHVWEGVSSATTRSRPIINTRDEPHADSHKYRRLHVIVGDTNVAQPSFALKVGATCLVLEMIEAGFELPEYPLDKDIRAIQDISRDRTGSAVLTLQDGRTVTALEVQRGYLAAATRWLQQRPDGQGTSNAEMAKVIELWQRTLEAIETDHLSLIDRDIDWAIKLQLLRRYQQRLGVDPTDFSHPKLAQIDLAYHDIRPQRGLASVLQAKGLINTWIAEEAVTHAINHPPATTRAALRGAFIQRARELGVDYSADWLRVKIIRPEPQIVEMGDPFLAVDSRVEALLATMEAHTHG
ncbi:Pup--protein ligase [Corynebacterium sp. HS2168-gen11]|uniref:Pup--protein ligase n=1 Tax=Corynebacterium sp. HS2168-gen11 TaxID=2974027 RepID=UPI00216B3B69|nr:Pup--protein ligase [Corynebacterium sp. HS2168-gen11]MCS4535080.1 Pup--protein ligase [Corynebacterium sp. HS2168-gen11]